jgi:hypothetical protein
MAVAVNTAAATKQCGWLWGGNSNTDRRRTVASSCCCLPPPPPAAAVVSTAPYTDLAGVESHMSLTDVCFKPFGTTCATQSILQYWQMNMTYYETGGWSFLVDYYSMLQ